jgi:hypothetical protein
MITASCGAWKDTLFEKFSITKFFRSPIGISAWALILHHFYSLSPSLLVAAAASSLERLTVEGWKAVIRKAPGKFQREGRDSGWLKDRIRGFRLPEWMHMAYDLFISNKRE